MALIRFNMNSLQVDVLVGIEESYKPTKNIKLINKKVKELKEGFIAFLKENFDTVDLKQVDKLANEDSSKKESIQAFIKEKISPEILDISKLVDEENKKLCPNYSELKKQE